jgi:hypothetical protein
MLARSVLEFRFVRLVVDAHRRSSQRKAKLLLDLLGKLVRLHESQMVVEHRVQLDESSRTDGPSS